MEQKKVGPVTKRLIKAREAASSLAARKSDAREVLVQVVVSVLAATGGEIAFLIIPSPQDAYAIHTVMSFDGRAVGTDLKVVSRELIDNARDMKDAVVSKNPFDVMVGVRGEYELKSGTLDEIPGLRSAIVVPLYADEQFVGALVIHEQNRTEPFTLDDRRVIEPLALFAAKLIADNAQRLRDEVAAPIVTTRKRPHRADDGLVGQAPKFVEVVEKADLVANSQLHVLITGESGTGKELFAQRIHAKSPRKKGPFIVVNMGCLGELCAAELFGYKRGAFTGANTDKTGLIEEAEGGTIFLDEIGEADNEAQVALLRFLESREIRPLGGIPKRVDVRVVAATNRELLDMVGAKTFKFDLYMRLAAIQLELPPLRERKVDIPLLASKIIEKIALENDRKPKALTAKALERLLGYDWPGNVRELQNVLAAGLIFSKGFTIDEDVIHLRAKTVNANPAVRPLTTQQRGYVRVLIALHQTTDKEEAIKLAKIHRSTYFDYLRAGRDIDPEGDLLPGWYRGD